MFTHALDLESLLQEAPPAILADQFVK